MIWACVFVTAVALYYTFHVPDAVTAGPMKTRSNYLRERKDVVYENLRDLNFEFKSGKFTQADYDAMRVGMEAEAARILAEIDMLESVRA